MEARGYVNRGRKFTGLVNTAEDRRVSKNIEYIIYFIAYRIEDLWGKYL